MSFWLDTYRIPAGGATSPNAALMIVAEFHVGPRGLGDRGLRVSLRGLSGVGASGPYRLPIAETLSVRRSSWANYAKLD